MICTNCSSEVPDSAKVCGHCGHRLRDTGPPSAAGPTPRSPRRWPWIAFGIFGLLAAVAGGIVAFAAIQANSNDGDITTTAAVAATTDPPTTTTSSTTAAAAITPATQAATTTEPTSAPLPTVPDLRGLTFEEAFDVAAAAGFTLVEGANIPLESAEAEALGIGRIVRTEPPRGAKHDPGENLWAEIGYDAGMWVPILAGDPGTWAPCYPLGGDPLPADIDKPIGSDRLDCMVQVTIPADTPFFVSEGWSQGTWPDEKTNYVQYTLDGEEPYGYRTIERHGDRYDSYWFFSLPGLPPGSHELVAEWWIDAELALRARVDLRAEE